MTRRIVVGGILGAVVLGVCLAGIGLTNGSPQGVAIWTISVGDCAGAVSGAAGGMIGKRGVKS